jgi:phenylalanyl-tRNA synthetase alpha chain
MDTLTAFTEYETAALGAIAAADTAERLEAVRVEFLGQKKGRLRDLQSLVGKAGAEERPALGKRFNEVKQSVGGAFEARKAQLEQPAVALSAIDITLPGEAVAVGRRHLITQTIDEFKDLMGRFGFTAVEGPEVEDEWHNFVALNIPEDHPARDPLDNFYVAAARPAAGLGADGDGGPVLLRSQTSTVQIRVMEHTPPPVRVVSVGRVYRPDKIDDTHHVMFHQMEGLMVDRGVTMAHLKTVLHLFARAYLGEDTEIRFRPSFFPFTEPSVEVDVSWQGGWMEIGGAGMVDPNVLAAVGYDPEDVTGFAFGLGIERFCMRRHNVTDIRRFYENDVRFLRQF